MVAAAVGRYSDPAHFTECGLVKIMRELESGPDRFVKLELLMFVLGLRQIHQSSASEKMIAFVAAQVAELTKESLSATHVAGGG
jgi:hypothetical protein